MIISLALLGYGASGTLLTILREKMLGRYRSIYIGSILLFALSMPGSYLLSQQIQFNAEQIFWAPEHGLRLMAIYLLLVLPFFFAATAIGLSLIRFHKNVPHIYAADLLGAGSGALIIILFLYFLSPGETLRYLTLIGLITLVIGSLELFVRNRIKWILIYLPIIAVLILSPDNWFKLHISPYKSLSQTLSISGTNIVEQRNSPLGLITAVESKKIPFRHAPGMSLRATAEPPEQIGLFIDGDAMTVITRNDGKQEEFSYLDQLTSALPYHLHEKDKQLDDVLILGAGGGSGILQANYYGVKNVRAVELDTNIINFVKERYKDFSGNLYNNRNIDVIADEARGFVTRDTQQYDLIQLEFFDSYSATSAGLYALSENYLYTVEALQNYLARLKPNGYLAISRWIKLPPRDTLKLFATAIEALKNTGISKPEQHLLLIRTMQTSTILIKSNPFTQFEINKARSFASERWFDIAYYPQMPIDDANQFNILSKPYFYLGAKALLSYKDEDSKQFLEDYKFNLVPATDNRPFFFHFFKWETLNEIISLVGEGGMPLLEWGYLILIATLAQALIGATFLIILPLCIYRKKKQTKAHLTFNIFLYFLSLGLAFLFIEIAFIQKFILFLSHPTFAIAVVLAAFLIFAGIGSLWSQRIAKTNRYTQCVKAAVMAIASFALFYTLFLSSIFSMLITLPIIAKIVISIILIAPLAFAMGIPFPLGLYRLNQIEQGLVPWVWGVNGCASVLSASLATIIAIHFGFTVVILMAVLLYLISTLSFNYWQK